MTLRQYLILMTVGTLICWSAWIFVILNIDPNQAGTIGMVFFYASLFLALVGTFSVIGFLIKRVLLKNDEVIFHHVKRTFRQGIIISSTLIVLLGLRQARLLEWWNSILIILLLIVVEGIIFTNRKHSNTDYV